ncbi:DnaJ-domain-containing protein [Hypoxylon sp. NC1633]|nr:DnaJ-domain-containing protein [Hypoxylon sp. NC1633]
MDDSDVLVAYAKEYADTQDLYELLGITSDTPKENIHSAWRKRTLKYHPDKAGANFDAAKWELFERAKQVLTNEKAREVYNAQRSAILLREEQRRTMDAKRRAMVEDLEARERGAVKRPRDERKGPQMSDAQRRELLESGKRRMEERRRQMAQAEEREKERQLERERERENETRQQKTSNGTSNVADSKIDIDEEPAARKDPDDERRIADLERRLKELEERKAAKKAKKAARRKGSPEAHLATETKVPGISQDLKADEKKGTTLSSSSSSAAPKSFSFSPAVGGKGDFSSTMARLRAAQAEKEARKKTEAAKAAGTVLGSSL